MAPIADIALKQGTQEYSKAGGDAVARLDPNIASWTPL